MKNTNNIKIGMQWMRDTGSGLNAFLSGEYNSIPLGLSRKSMSPRLPMSTTIVPSEVFVRGIDGGLIIWSVDWRTSQSPESCFIVELGCGWIPHTLTQAKQFFNKITVNRDKIDSGPVDGSHTRVRRKIPQTSQKPSQTHFPTFHGETQTNPSTENSHGLQRKTRTLRAFALPNMENHDLSHQLRPTAFDFWTLPPLTRSFKGAATCE